MAKEKPIPTLSEQTSLLVAFLKDREEASYEELSKHIGGDVRSQQNRGYLYTARRVLQREYGQVWLPVRGVGLALGDPSQVIDSAKSEISRMHKSARRGIKRISTLDFDALDNDERVRLNTTASHLGCIHAITTRRADQMLKAAISAQPTPAKLPLTATLNAFRGGHAANGGEKKEE